MKKSILIVTMTLALVGYFVFTNSQKTNNDCFITLNNQRFDLTLAKTEAERQQGLSGTQSLAQNTGKLFVFDTPSIYGFWMKDMNYAIDIIWFDSDLKIVGMAKNATPSSYPNVFYPKQNALYVLEIGAGNAEMLNLDFGTIAQLNCRAI